MRTLVGGIACLVVLALAPIAEGAQRYAAPAGGGPEPCAQAAPCSLTVAIKKAQAGDEVIVGSGTYTVVEGLFPEGEGVYVHGDFAAPMPTVKAATFEPVIVGSQNSRIAYLEVDNLSDFGSGIFCPQGGTVERVRVKVTGTRSAALQAISGCAVRDSLLRAEGTKSLAFVGAAFEDGFTGIVRNVTAIATGPESIGVYGDYGPALAGNYTIDVRNTIVEGAMADLYATEGTGGFGNIVVAGSNFDRPKQDFGAKVTDAGGNQAVPPLFVNAAGGDYREAAGSPTIDAGVSDQLGALDLAGNPRVFGTAPDIGAYEFVPVVPEIQSLTITPRAFRAPGGGGAVASAKKKAKAPVGATVGYALSAAASVEFAVERKLVGRKSGKKCVKKTKANKGRKKCPLFKPVKGGISNPGAAGQNSFEFSGKIAGKALAPGTYRLTGRVGVSARSAGFKIVK